MRRPLPTATIVICARNAAAHLRRSVPAALTQDYPAGRFKVLVVDNASTDDTAEVAAELGAAVRHCPRPGVVHARQFAWKSARSDLVAFLDADCEPPTDWLRRLADLFRDHERLGAAGPRLISPPPASMAERHIIETGILDTDRFWQRNALQWPFLVTAAIVLRRKALEDIGGFDLKMGAAAGEDADLCWRLERAGWGVRYVKEIEVLHHHRATILAMLKQTHWYGLGSATVFAKWRDELGWWRYTDWAPYRRIARGLLRAPGKMIAARDSYERWAPLLEVLDGSAFLLGKWRGALKHGVLFL